jgi:hypothetical protein
MKSACVMSHKVMGVDVIFRQIARVRAAAVMKRRGSQPCGLVFHIHTSASCNLLQCSIVDSIHYAT